MERPRRSAFVVSLVVVSLASFLAARTARSAVGHVKGVVVDATGAVLPGVAISLSRAGVSDRVTVTDRKGAFAFLSVEVGRYTITASLAGFNTRTAIVDVTEAATKRLSIALQVGGLEETVAVVGALPPVSAFSASRMAVGSAQRADSFRRLVGPFNTEAYDRINDNQWAEVARRPLSTFSADVDTASYSNVRRFLKAGEAPPKDAVRIEELLNYFTFDYPEPRDGKPFSITTAIGKCPWNSTHRLALIGLQAKRIDPTHIPPRNLVFLIDVSGSMDEPNKLPLVKASLAMLAPNLTGNDRVAIVVYAGSSGLVLPSTSGGDTTAIVDSLHRLEAGGSTNGGEGLILAYKTAERHFIKGGVNRVILATDGDFNVGVTDQGSLIRLIEEKRRSGIALSVLGYGMGNLKDSTMVKLADAGNGNYAYIDSLAEARKVLVEQAGGTLVTVAKDVKLQVEFNPRSVAAYRLIGYEKRVLEDQDFNNDDKDAGEMGAGHSVTVLYELIPAGAPMDVPTIDPLKYQQRAPLANGGRSDEALTVKVRYKEPDGERSALLEVPVANRMGRSPHVGFAAAVAEFGMLLHGSEHKGSSSFAGAAALAKEFKGDDPYGHRAEFIRLIDAAESVTRVKATASR